jgi:hypothetical protein
MARVIDRKTYPHPEINLDIDIDNSSYFTWISQYKTITSNDKSIWKTDYSQVAQGVLAILLALLVLVVLLVLVALVVLEVLV